MKTRMISVVAMALVVAALPAARATELPADVRHFLTMAGEVSAKLVSGEPIATRKHAPARRIAKAAKPAIVNPFAVTAAEQRNPTGDVVALGDYCLGPVAALITPM